MLKSAKPKDLSKAEEKYWKEAEKIVKKQYDESKEPGKFYGTVSNIFKSLSKKNLGYNPYEKARERKKKREKAKKKKKAEWQGRAHRFMKQADLTSNQVPELIKEDLLPTLERIENELSDLAKNVADGFETGDSKNAAETELKTYREMADKLDNHLKETRHLRDWFSDLKNTTFTDVTGKMPKSGSRG